VILQRVLMAVVAGAAMAAAAVIATVALAFAIYAFVLPHAGPANAAAAVAAVYAGLIGLAGLLAARGAGGYGFGRHRVDEADAMNMAERLITLAKEKPLVAVGLALAAGFILMRSPRAMGAIARAFFDSMGGTTMV
jgi:hypothetical protein